MVKRHGFLLACILLFVLFWFSATRTLDPDFGWHIRLGQIIASEWIPKTDPFSYTMSYYPFVDHEWLTNLAISYLYQSLGFYGLIFLAIIIAFAALLLQTVFLEKRQVLVPFLLTGTALIGYLGIRPQLISWLFISILSLLFIHKKLWLKFRFFLPLLLLLWANTHGSFALGAILIGLYVLMKQLQTKQMLATDWIVFILCIAATLITPYGTRSWWEVWMQVSDSGLRWSIQEWLPAFFIFNFSFMLLLALSLVLIFRYRKNFNLVEWVFYLFLLFLGLSSVRHLPFWLIFSLSLTTRAMSYFVREANSNEFGRKNLSKAYKILLFVAVFIMLSGFFVTIFFRPISITAEYPDKAIIFLKTYPSQGRLFAPYVFGGYLIWKYGEEKVFIDGRMPSWRSKTAPSGQSTNAFYEYQNAVSGKTNLTQFLTKYKIDTVMISVHEEKSLPILIENKLAILFGLKSQDQKTFKERLEEQKMRIVYKDDVVIIYQKK